MTMVGADAAWYADPSDPTCLRWWDGQHWTPHTRPVVAGDSAVGASASGWGGGSASGLGGQTGSGQPVGGLNLRGTGFKGRNHYSLITFGVGALYLVLAYFVHFVLIGFIPLGLAMRAKRSEEPLAPFAIGAAVVVILISVLSLFH